MFLEEKAAARCETQTEQKKEDTGAPSMSAAANAWRECTDPGSGRRYWYNTATKESSWVAPATLASVNVAQDTANDVRRTASPARSLTPPRLQAAVRKVQTAVRFTEHWDDATGPVSPLIQSGTRVLISLWDSLMFGRVPKNRRAVLE